MEVTFRRTGERRYAVIARPERWPAVTMDPAPGFDPCIPHDLIHFAIEREFAIERGVFGQLAAGGDVTSFWRLDDLSAQWRTLGVRGTLTLHWPETAGMHVPPTAATAARRQAHRARGRRGVAR